MSHPAGEISTVASSDDPWRSTLTDRGHWPRQRIAWAGGLFITAIIGLAVYDIVRGHGEAMVGTVGELDAHARILAEQTARSVQAVDLVARHISQSFRAGSLRAINREDVTAYLKDQEVGLVAIDGLLLADRDGNVLGSSRASEDRAPAANISATPIFAMARDEATDGAVLGSTRRSGIDGRWQFPLARRLQSPTGEFSGVLVARFRVDYFEHFYRDVRLGPGSAMTLVHRDGVVVARYPVSEAALGERFAPLAALVASGVPLSANPIRATSPIDGIERFGAFQWVPGYPLGVLVTRDTRTALAPWRSQAIGTAARTLTLGALAAVLLAMLMRQHASLDASRRSAEASQARFVAAMTGSDSGIWGMDFVAGQGYGSPRMRQLLGLPPGPDTQPLDPRREEVERQVHPDDLERRRIAMEDHLAGRTDAYNVDYRVRRPDGRWHWIQVHGRCMRDTEGQPLQMAGSVIDIDARKRAEESLRASEERLALVISSSNEGILDWDVINDRMVVSQRALRILGLDESAPVDSQAQWASLAMPRFQPEDALRLAERLRGDAGTLADTHDGEYRVRDATGEHRWTRFRWVTVRDGGGRAVRWAGSLTDIDDRKRAEERRQRLEEKLRRAQKLESIGTLAGGIAHDFNNILAAVLGYGEMVQKDLREGSPQRKHIDAAMSAGMRGKSLVERILAFSRSGMGPRVPVHVQSVVEEALQAIAASLPARVQLVRRLDSGTSGVIGDPTQVHQVVMNLCTNAVHAMKDGGTLDVVLESTRLTEPFAAAAGTLPVGEYLRLEIADSGSGMTPEVLARIFDPFFTTKEVGVGTGLGLSLVHGIVADLGGGIVVRSQAGSGSRFIVYLPRQTDVPRTEEAVTQEVERGDGQTVLLVDDELALVRLGEETLAEFGYEPIGFASSEAALQAFRADPDRFDVLVSDEAMPGLTGTELAREVRALRPGLPVLLMSGFITPAIADSAREAGVMQLLSKPLAARELTQALATALRRQSDGASN